MIAVSDGMRRDILRSYPSIDPGACQVVYNGIDLADWKPNHDAETVARRSASIPTARR